MQEKSEDKLKKNDFVEIEYTGKTKEGEIFDTNIEAEAKKISLDIKTRPLTICIGQNMILPAIDEFLIGKEIGKRYILELSSDKAFGIRNKNLIKTMPLSVFQKHKISPQQGMIFSFDGLFGKIISSGTRIIVDFNNPMAGKDVIYELNLKRKITDLHEKTKALMLVFFKQEFEFKIEEKKLIIKVPENIKKFVELFKEKFREILDLESEVEEKKA